MRNTFSITLAGLALIFLFMAPGFALAQSGVGGDRPPSGIGGDRGPSGASPGNSVFVFSNPLGDTTTVCALIKKLLQAALVIGIPIAVVFLVYAGFLFVWARGSVDGLTKAKKNLGYTLLGIAIFLGAWVLGQVIANTVNAIQPGTVSGTNSC